MNGACFCASGERTRSLRRVAGSIAEGPADLLAVFGADLLVENDFRPLAQGFGGGKRRLAVGCRLATSSFLADRRRNLAPLLLTCSRDKQNLFLKGLKVMCEVSQPCAHVAGHRFRSRLPRCRDPHMSLSAHRDRRVDTKGPSDRNRCCEEGGRTQDDGYHQIAHGIRR